MRDSLKERYEKADVERDKLSDWYDTESKKIFAELERTGKYVAGLDTNREAFKALQNEYQHRFLEIYDKYDLPNKPVFPGINDGVADKLKAKIDWQIKKTGRTKPAIKVQTTGRMSATVTLEV